MKFENRDIPASAYNTLLSEQVTPLLAQCWAARGIQSLKDVQGTTLLDLIPYTQLDGAVDMAEILAEGIALNKHFVIVADYDADGATACSVGVLGLRMMEARVDYIIPDRQVHGYGITPTIVDLVKETFPTVDYIITVDNGIAAHAGIAHANSLGIPVLVTDHHLPTEVHPDAKVIVNPNKHGCPFPSKNLAGVGAMWYVLWALQDKLYGDDAYLFGLSPVERLLPIVAVGTVADVVVLDYNNRTLINMGLAQLRDGETIEGIDALCKIAGRSADALSTSDIAFKIAPRINAAGRLQSMNAGVSCLTAKDANVATQLALELDQINKDRKEREAVMGDEALNQLVKDIKETRKSIALFSDSWHIGIIGIVAGRLKDKMWRPTFILAKGDSAEKSNEIKGSGRSLPGFHLRDALVWIDTKYPGIFIKYGGHAMAAGVTIHADKLKEFQDAFEEVASLWLTEDMLQQIILTDGALNESDMSLDNVRVIREQVWGQGFPQPLFRDTFEVISARMIGKDAATLKLTLRKVGGQQMFDAIKFKHNEGIPFGHIDAVYRLDVNDFRGERSLQLMIDQYDIVAIKG